MTVKLDKKRRLIAQLVELLARILGAWVSISVWSIDHHFSHPVTEIFSQFHIKYHIEFRISPPPSIISIRDDHHPRLFPYLELTLLSVSSILANMQSRRVPFLASALFRHFRLLV